MLARAHVITREKAYAYAFFRASAALRRLVTLAAQKYITRERGLHAR